MQTPFRARLGALFVGATVACLAGAAPALAAPCAVQLKDATNANFDLTSNGWFTGAGIVDGQVLNGDGTELANDAYDGGPVFNVLDLDANPAADPAAPAPEDVYPFAAADAADGCQTAQDGREMLYPEKTIHTDIAMSRRIYVSATGLAGARFVDTVRNTGAAPRHLRLVQGWDSVNGDLGSDSNTAFVAANTATVGNDTRWIVTDDTLGNPPSAASDPKLSHVFDGPGNVDTVDAIHLVDGSDLFYFVRDVTLAPGESASFVFYEGMTALANRVAADEDAAAVQLAADRFGQSADSLYAGLPADVVATVRNWQRPAVTPSIALVGDAKDNGPVSLSSSADLGASMCSLASREWTVDGAPAGSDTTLTRAYAAGAHAVSLKVTSTCGTSGVAAGTLTVAHVEQQQNPITTTDPHTPGLTVFRTPAKPVKVAKGKAVLSFSCADADGCSASSFTLTGPKVTVRDKHGKKTTKRAFVLTIKVPVTTKAGTPRVTVKLTKAARSAVAKAGKKGVKVTVAPRGAKSGVSFRLVA